MDLQTENLTDLRVFYEVAKSLSFSTAAISLKMSKSTVSERISVLETNLNQSLFLRTTRQVRLTEIGETFYKRVAILLMGVKEAEDEIVGMIGKPRGLIKVSAPRGYEESNIVNMLIEFNQRFPEIYVKIDFTDRVIDLLGEGYDLALRIGDLKDSSLISKQITSHKFRFVCSPKYMACREKSSSYRDLNFSEYVEFKMKNTDNWRVLEKGTQSFKALPDGKVQTNSIKFVKLFLSRGKGFSFLPDFLCSDEIKRGELKPFLENCTGNEMKVYLIYPQKRFILPRVKMLIDSLSKSHDYSNLSDRRGSRGDD